MGRQVKRRTEAYKAWKAVQRTPEQVAEGREAARARFYELNPGEVDPREQRTAKEEGLRNGTWYN